MPSSSFEFIGKVELRLGPLIGRQRGEKVVGGLAHALHKLTSSVTGWLVGMHDFVSFDAR